jgi:hypothetical protein
MRWAMWFAAPALLAACGTNAGQQPPDSGGLPDASGADGGCALIERTTATGTVADGGCAVLDRDVSSCEASRTAAGLSGVWLKFSCRLPIAKVTSATGAEAIRVTTDSLPDYRSNYFATTHACWESYTAAIQNPNLIKSQTIAVDFPAAPNATGQPMQGAIVGVALNGVGIFSNRAAPGDDIYKEVLTFDRCGAHPQQAGVYHYHSEPYALSFDDARLIGVLRDGYPIYGRRDSGGAIPTDLDAAGGHTGVTADSAGAAVYHYHLNLQTSTTAGTAGQSQWFLTRGAFHGTPGTCTGCQ